MELSEVGETARTLARRRERESITPWVPDASKGRPPHTYGKRENLERIQWMDGCMINIVPESERKLRKERKGGKGHRQKQSKSKLLRIYFVLRIIHRFTHRFTQGTQSSIPSAEIVVIAKNPHHHHHLTCGCGHQPSSPTFEVLQIISRIFPFPSCSPTSIAPPSLPIPGASISYLPSYYSACIVNSEIIHYPNLVNRIHRRRPCTCYLRITDYSLHNARSICLRLESPGDKDFECALYIPSLLSR
ncbi:hypothetical protein F4778DRAFT_126208 [Xylariomycetidae sp. FL2044]|nr:hypothetical protein F4778DRAFT_126208 [Xylariomycetidae sp. FL2044]